MPRQSFPAAEAAHALGISLDTLRRWDRDGRIRVERDSANRRVVPASEIVRLRGPLTDDGLPPATGFAASSALSRWTACWHASRST